MQLNAYQNHKRGPFSTWVHSCTMARACMHAPTSNSFQQPGRRTSTRSIVFVRLRHGMIVTSYLYANFLKIHLLSETLKNFFIAFAAIRRLRTSVSPVLFGRWGTNGPFLGCSGHVFVFFFFFCSTETEHTCMSESKISHCYRERMKRPIRAGHNHVRSPGRKTPGVIEYHSHCALPTGNY